MLVKIRNLRRLLAKYPAVQRVTTFNAAENSHMLAINIALGFRPSATTANGSAPWGRPVPPRGRDAGSAPAVPVRDRRAPPPPPHGRTAETGICWR